MVYVFSVLPTPQDFIKQLNTIIYNFLWNGPDKIARAATINDIKCGALFKGQMNQNFDTFCLAFQT